MVNFSCRACSAPLRNLIVDFPSFPRVSSDCKPFRRGGELTICDCCGLVQKPETATWREECAEIYGHYALYFQSATGTEQKFFDAHGVGRPRTEYTLSTLFARFTVPAQGTMLDVGSGTGAVLRAFHKVLPQWAMDALEPNEASYPALEKVAGIRTLLKTDIAAVQTKYDIVTAFHVLEHIPSLGDFLAKIRSCLTENGIAIFQVPNYSKNPFDLIVADHCTHFDPQSIAHTLALSGFEPVLIDDGLIPKELTVICKASDAMSSLQNNNAQSLQQVATAIGFLQATSTAIDAVAATQSAPVGVFGSSIAAAFCAAGLSGRVAFFVDEDMSRVGGTFLDCPILSPELVPAGTEVCICGPRQMSTAIAARLDSPRVRYRSLLG